MPKVRLSLTLCPARAMRLLSCCGMSYRLPVNIIEHGKRRVNRKIHTLCFSFYATWRASAITRMRGHKVCTVLCIERHAYALMHDGQCVMDGEGALDHFEVARPCVGVEEAKITQYLA